MMGGKWIYSLISGSLQLRDPALYIIGYSKFKAILGVWLAVESNVAAAC